MTRSPFYLEFTFPNGLRSLMNLPQGDKEIGRAEIAESCGYFDDTISARHLAFRCTEAACEIRERGSANGTWINGQRFTSDDAPRRLAISDRVAIGGIDVDEVVQRTEFIFLDQRSLEIREIARQHLGRRPTPARPSSELITDNNANSIGPAEYRFLFEHLPQLYQSSEHDFMRRLLALFDQTLLPIRMNITNFDLYLDTDAMSPDFVTWILGWYGVLLDDTWDGSRARSLLQNAPQIFAWRGTARALRCLLSIYVDCQENHITIREGAELPEDTFAVELPFNGRPESAIRRVIEAYIPLTSRFLLIDKGT